jgi:hypothetical protein
MHLLVNTSALHAQELIGFLTHYSPQLYVRIPLGILDRRVKTVMLRDRTKTI